jgi:hypothetical protein
MASSRPGTRESRSEKVVAQAPASPEFVLDVLRDNHRHQCAFDPEADPTAQLSFDTTVAEWRIACDLIGTKGLGEALNETWELTIPPDAWQAVLEPPKSRTLRDVCELISSRTQRTLVLKAGYLGASSRSAAAFLAVRSLLLRAGADPATVRPSAPRGRQDPPSRLSRADFQARTRQTSDHHSEDADLLCGRSDVRRRLSRRIGVRSRLSFTRSCVGLGRCAWTGRNLDLRQVYETRRSSLRRDRHVPRPCHGHRRPTSLTGTRRLGKRVLRNLTGWLADRASSPTIEKVWRERRSATVDPHNS